MNAGRSKHGPPISTTRLLFVGFASTLLLTILTSGLAVREAIRVERFAVDFAESVTESTYQLSEIGEHLARTRANVAQGLREPPEQFERRLRHIALLDARLAGLLDSVDQSSTFDPATQVVWAMHEAEVRRLGRVYADAASLIRSGKADRASALLAREAVATTSFHEELDELQTLHHASARARLESMQRQAGRFVITGLTIAALFLAGLLLIFVVMALVLRRRTLQVAEYTARLELANADLDAFAGRVAHDLRNALGPVMMGPHMLRASSQSPDVHRIADRMERSMTKGVALIDALLAFSRAAQTAESRESESLRAAVRSAAEELAAEIARVDATIEIGELPDVRVRCSPELLHIVLMNLAGNAIKYLEGRPERRLRISAHVDDSSCRIDVEDTGPGIPPDALQKIFEPFYRVPGNSAPGTGIGLATVRRVVEQHGGRIAVASTEGTGTRFRVWLPLRPADELAVSSGQASRPIASAR